MRGVKIYLKTFLLYASYFVISALFTYFLAPKIESFLGIERYYYTSFLIYFIFLIVTIFLNRRINKRDRDFKFEQSYIASIVVLSIVFYAINNCISNSLLIFGVYDYPDIGINAISNEEHVIRILDSIIITPIFEELFFRGIILFVLIKATNRTTFSILFSTVLFAIDHINPFFIVESIPGIINAFIFGIIASWLFVKTRNLFYPILLHILVNLIVYIINSFNVEYWGFIKYLDFDYRYWLIIIISFILLFMMLKRISRWEVKHNKN